MARYNLKNAVQQQTEHEFVSVHSAPMKQWCERTCALCPCAGGREVWIRAMAKNNQKPSIGAEQER